jgi:hypothetical protein
MIVNLVENIVSAQWLIGSLLHRPSRQVSHPERPRQTDPQGKTAYRLLGFAILARLQKALLMAELMLQIVVFPKQMVQLSELKLNFLIHLIDKQ